MHHTFVFGESIIDWRRRAFRVDALDCCIEPAQVVASIHKRRLREQQNEEDDENY